MPDIEPTVIQTGDGPTDIIFTDLSTLDGDLAATLEISPKDKETFDKMVSLGVTPDQATKIICILLLYWKANVQRANLSQTLKIILPPKPVAQSGPLVG